MKKYFLNKTNIKKENVHVLPSHPYNAQQVCKDYESKIKKSSGIDLQILGLGRNGHVGFNEPGSSFASRTRKVTLTSSTKQANKIKINHALTIGIATILESRKIVLIATGKHKAHTVKCMLKEKISTSCPASALRKHKNALILLDKQAASGL